MSNRQEPKVKFKVEATYSLKGEVLDAIELSTEKFASSVTLTPERSLILILRSEDGHGNKERVHITMSRQGAYEIGLVISDAMHALTYD
jgi:hypothetical protein